MGVLGKINIGGEVSLLAIVLVEIGIVAAVIYLVCKLIKALKRLLNEPNKSRRSVRSISNPFQRVPSSLSAYLWAERIFL